jgi:hypothetical protein
LDSPRLIFEIGIQTILQELLVQYGRLLYLHLSILLLLLLLLPIGYKKNDGKTDGKMNGRKEAVNSSVGWFFYRYLAEGSEKAGI